MPARPPFKVPVFLAIAVIPFISRAADWPQWRGPRRDALSTETGLLKEWPPTGPPLAWKTKGLGAGHATISVAGDKIFVHGDTGEARLVHALTRAGGKDTWRA